MDFVIGFGMIKNVNAMGLQLLHGSSKVGKGSKGSKGSKG